MINMKILGTKVIVTAILGLSLIGCGGGDSSSNGRGSTIPTEATTKTGTFVDSPVEGLKYSTSTLSGFTDNQGRFQYKDGETVTFKIGGLELGSAKGSELITPLTLTNESDLNNISSKSTNIARVLQSLDEEPTNSGLIKIPSSLKNLNIPSIDIESDADLNTILQKAQDITSKDYVLKDSITAKSDMKKYIELYNKYSLLGAGTYSGKGTKYYMLTMPSDGNVDFNGNGILLYDTNLNPIKTPATYFNQLKGITPLLAGNYIINIPLYTS